jgi:hypothetical protein
MVDLLLLVLACICFGLAAINVKSPVNLVALGLLFYAARGLL